MDYMNDLQEKVDFLHHKSECLNMERKSQERLICDLQAEVESLKHATVWRPIDTAPKVSIGGTAYLACDSTHHHPYVIVWLDADHPSADGAGWYEHWNFDPVEPTHWMPLPNIFRGQ